MTPLDDVMIKAAELMKRHGGSPVLVQMPARDLFQLSRLTRDVSRQPGARCAIPDERRPVEMLRLITRDVWRTWGLSDEEIDRIMAVSEEMIYVN